MSDQSKLDIEDFVGKARALASEAEQGRRIREAAEKGVVPTIYYRHESAPGEDGRHRELARDAINEVWAYQHRPASLDEIYAKVLTLIAYDVEAGDWPGIWTTHPKKRTIDRRTNEIAQKDRPQFWLGLEVPPCLCVKPGFYQPNPYLFDESVKQAIGEVAKS